MWFPRLLGRGGIPVFYGFHLKMACITFVYSSLVETSHMTLLQGILGYAESTWDMWGARFVLIVGLHLVKGLGSGGSEKSKTACGPYCL